MLARGGRRVAALLAALALGGGGAMACGGSAGGEGDRSPRASEPVEAVGERDEPRAPNRSRGSDRLRPPPCPAAVSACRAVSGRIAYVEAVDPDGDGDAHFVLLGSDSVSAPGLTAVDVRRDLRPTPLPGVGDVLGAAGPVKTGSHGQQQVEAVAVRVRRG